MASSQPPTVPDSDRPWHAAYPAPKATAPVIARETVQAWMQTGRETGKDFILIDLRRTDYEGGTIHGSINLPAQSLYPTIPALYTLFSAAGVKDVVWYCGSSKGRGTRAAGWFTDHIKAASDTNMESSVLEGGIKGWVIAGDEYVALVDGYDPSVWKSS